MLKSRVQQSNFRKSSLSPAQARHTVLLAMAADAEKLRAQAERIKELRKEKERRDGEKVSQETAAHGIGVSVRTYRTWESTGADLRFENLKALAGYYDTTVDYIEHGRERGSTPDLSLVGELSQLDKIEAMLKKNTETLANLSRQMTKLEADALANVGAVLQRIDEVEAAIGRSPRPQRRSASA